MRDIYTLTPNPGLDRTLFVDQIAFNEVLRAKQTRLDWGGKGFNVARVLKFLGVKSTVLGFVGGTIGRQMAEGLASLDIATDFVFIRQESRVNTVFQELESPRYVKVNEAGPSIQPDEIQALYGKVESLARPGSLWVLAGSLAPGLPDDFYACLIARIKERGGSVCLDASGTALQKGCQAQPYLVKPNTDEAAELTGMPVNSPAQAAQAAEAILSLGVSMVVISLGSQGLVMADHQQLLHAITPPVEVKGVTGAGDSCMAGMVWAVAQDLELPGIARAGAAMGTASVMNSGVAEINPLDFYRLLNNVQLVHL